MGDRLPYAKCVPTKKSEKWFPKSWIHLSHFDNIKKYKYIKMEKENKDQRGEGFEKIFPWRELHLSFFPLPKTDECWYCFISPQHNE